jgi:hypothetical protein
MTLEEIIAGLRARASQTVPWAGDALSGSKRGAAYAAGKNGTLGVPIYQSGGLLRTASIDIARRLGLEDVVTAPAKTEEPAKIAAAAAASAIPLTAPKPASIKAHKAPARKAVAARKAPVRKAAPPPRPARRQSRSPEAVS